METDQEIAILRRQLEQERAARREAEELAESQLEIIEALTQRSSPAASQTEVHTDTTLLIKYSYKEDFQFIGATRNTLLKEISQTRRLALKRLLYSRFRGASNIKQSFFEVHLNRKHYNVLILPNHEKEHYTIYVSDITNRTKTEPAFSEASNVADKVVHTIPNIIYIYDVKKGKSIYINEHIKSMLGYSDTDIASITEHQLKSMLLPKETLRMHRHVQQMRQAADGMVLQVEYRVKCKDGTVKNIYCRESVFKRKSNGQVKQIIGSAEDVTLLREKSEELQKQKEFYESILNHIPSDVAVYNKDLEYIFLNPAAIPDPELRKWIIGKTNEDYSRLKGIPAERMKVRSGYLDKVLQQRKLVEFEEATRDRDGNESHHIRRLNPVLNEKQEVQLVISHGLNITDLRKAQNKIAASEAKNKAILAAIPDSMFIINKDGYYVDMNEVDERHLLVPKHTLIGSHVSSTLPKELAAKVTDIIQKVLTTGRHANLEYELNFASGTRYYEGRLLKYNENEVLTIVRDNTEERKAALEVKEKNEFIRHVIDTSPSLIFVKNAKGEFTLVNTECAKFFGKTVNEMVGVNSALLFPKKDEAALIGSIDRQVIEEGREIKLEEKFTKPDGSVIWVSAIKKPIVMRTGEVQVLSIATNITEQRTAKQRLEESEELFRLLSENSKDLISLHEPNGQYIYISKACKELLGYEPEELIGRMPAELLHPDDKELVAEKTSADYLLQHHNVLIQHRLICKDGTVQWVETNIKPVLNATGEVVKIQSAARDITERKNAEEALKANEKKYRDLIKYSRAYLCTHNMEGVLQEVNPHMHDMLGYTTEEMIGQRLEVFLPAHHKPNFSNYLKEFEKKNLVDGIFTVLNKENKKRYLFYKNYKVEEPNTKPYIICIAQDITERVYAEREMKLAKEAAEESAREKENFLANMSHEIRTPMNGIMGMASLLKKSPLDTSQQNYVNIIRQSADNLLVIIDDILDVAKIEAGKLELEKIPFNISDTVHAAYQTLSYKAAEKELVYQIKPLLLEHQTLIGDPYRLNQVLLNLLGNAIKFTQTGSVTLSSQILEETDEMLMLEFSVTDTGIGIPADKMEYIFEGFSQAYSSTTRKYGGTGLGLSICRNLVEMQGGRIWVESEKESGSTFKFTLRYPKSKEAHVRKQRKAVDFTKLSGTKVLLAEDNEINIFLAKSIMESWNFSVDVAKDGREAVKMAEQNNYDVILMDIQMPEMSGLDATRLIRSNPDKCKSEVPIIALTANALKGDAEKYLSIGMNAYISKPFEEEELYIKIANTLSHKEVPCKTEISTTTRQVTTASESLYDLSLVHKMSRGNEAFIKRTKSLFLETVPETLSEINRRQQNEDWNGVSAAAHKLKSTIDTLRIEKLRSVIRQIQSGAKKEGTHEDVIDNVSYLNEVMTKVLEQMKKEV